MSSFASGFPGGWPKQSVYRTGKSWFSSSGPIRANVIGVTERRLRSMSMNVVWAARTMARARLPDSRSITLLPSMAQTSPQGAGVQGMKSVDLMLQLVANFSTRFAGIVARIRPAASCTAPA